MPQAKASKKKPAAKVGGGGVGTKKSKFNFKIMIPVVVLVAALGGFYIFQKSSAAVWVYHSGNSYSPTKSLAYGARLDSSQADLPGPFSYRPCVMVRSTGKAVNIEVNLNSAGPGQAVQINVPTSTKFEKKCGASIGPMSKNGTMRGYATVVSRGAGVEIQKLFIERM